MSIEKSVIFANQSKLVLETSFWDTSKVLSSTRVNFLERLLEFVYFVCPIYFFLIIFRLRSRFGSLYKTLNSL